MMPAIVFTDLDGTLLEPDGTVSEAALAALGELRGARVPVCAVTSKTVAELDALAAVLGLDAPAGFENGAGVWWPDGRAELGPSAIPMDELAEIAATLGQRTGTPLRTLFELHDVELTAMTGLCGAALAAARERRATLPLIVDAVHDEALRSGLPTTPRLRLVRGNRFLHLQGAHDKADVVPRLRELAARGPGVAVACGDAPNDADLLAAADIRVIVPGSKGPHPELLRLFPDAIVAPLPHGPGWAAALRGVLADARRQGSRAAGRR
jgi:mannosyl-3-phosphoglycerate phosphatase